VVLPMIADIVIHPKFSAVSTVFPVECRSAYAEGTTVDERVPMVDVEYRIGSLKPFTRRAVVDFGCGPQLDATAPFTGL